MFDMHRALSETPVLSRAADWEGGMTLPVVRVSILRCEPEQFQSLRGKMVEAEEVLSPGIRAMTGLIAYFAGADEASCSLTNVSIWETETDARQMERFQPMLDLGKSFAEAGARFERPIMNYQRLWTIGNVTSDPRPRAGRPV
jgi:hypothetical protein